LRAAEGFRGRAFAVPAAEEIKRRAAGEPLAAIATRAFLLGELETFHGERNCVSEHNDR
jgi:hypothetical protein